jgi:hypothetical protein
MAQTSSLPRLVLVSQPGKLFRQYPDRCGIMVRALLGDNFRRPRQLK